MRNSTSRNFCVFSWIFCRCSLDFVSIVLLFSVDVCSVLCRFFVYFLSMFVCLSVNILAILCPYSVCIIAGVHRKQHKPAQRLRNRPPTNGPTYCIVPFLVSWLNIIFCNQKSTVLIYDTIIMSKVDLKKLLSVFCRHLLGFVSILRLFCADVCLCPCQYSFCVLSVFCLFYCACSHEAAQARFAPPDSTTQEWSHLLYRPTYWTSHLLYHDWI